MPSGDEILIRRYSSPDAKEWDGFVSTAKNSTFLFQRSYMDYHADRFADHSLMIYVKGKLSALFVANENKNIIESHGGLTYGGMILEKDVRLEEVLRYFFHITNYYAPSFERIIYKCVPSYLAQYPSSEDLYALFLLNAPLVRRDTSMVLDRDRPLAKEKKKPKAQDLFITSTSDPTDFWTQILTPALKERFDTGPVHTADEMKMLMQRFPRSIKLFEISGYAGAVVYEMPNAVHLQYLSSNDKGRQANAPDILVQELIDGVYTGKQFFSFGTSNGGGHLNRGLATWKERFGARTYVHDFYEIATKNYTLLKDYE